MRNFTNRCRRFIVFVRQAAARTRPAQSHRAISSADATLLRDLKRESQRPRGYEVKRVANFFLRSRSRIAFPPTSLPPRKVLSGKTIPEVSRDLFAFMTNPMQQSILVLRLPHDPLAPPHLPFELMLSQLVIDAA